MKWIYIPSLALLWALAAVAVPAQESRCAWSAGCPGTPEWEATEQKAPETEEGKEGTGRQMATTDDGKRVELKEDGTWAYVEVEAGKKKADVCAMKTVFVDGNNRSAVEIRKLILKETWMALESKMAEADAVLEIEESQKTETFLTTRSYTVVSGALKDKKTQELLWNGSREEGGSYRGPYRTLLLRDMVKELGCKK